MLSTFTRSSIRAIESFDTPSLFLRTPEMAFCLVLRRIIFAFSACSLATLASLSLSSLLGLTIHKQTALLINNSHIVGISISPVLTLECSTSLRCLLLLQKLAFYSELLSQLQQVTGTTQNSRFYTAYNIPLYINKSTLCI